MSYEEKKKTDSACLLWVENMYAKLTDLTYHDYFLTCRFDDTDVSVMRYNYYGDSSDKYPTTIEIRYPKSGTNNPRVRLYVYNLRDKSEYQVQPPAEIPETRYVVAISSVVEVVVLAK